MNREEAIRMAESGIWKTWTPEEIVRFQLFEDLLCMPFDVFHEAIEKELGRSVWTHEFADVERLRSEYAGKKPPPTMQEILDMIPVEKRIIVTGEPPS